MRLSRSAIALSAAALVVAVSAPFAAHAATAQDAAHQPHASAAPSVAVYDCSNRPEVRPGMFDLFCDGSGYFIRLRWGTWNASMAAAAGLTALVGTEHDL